MCRCNAEKLPPRVDPWSKLCQSGVIGLAGHTELNMADGGSRPGHPAEPLTLCCDSGTCVVIPSADSYIRRRRMPPRPAAAAAEPGTQAAHQSQRDSPAQPSRGFWPGWINPAGTTGRGEGGSGPVCRRRFYSLGADVNQTIRTFCLFFPFFTTSWGVSTRSLGNERNISNSDSS